MYLRKPKKSFGFTLTELIIVIVIIGILAAVLIPTITHYVDRAKISKDTSNARNMNMLLSLEAYEKDFKSMNSLDLEEFLNSNGYNLVATGKDCYYLYDVATNTISLMRINSNGVEKIYAEGLDKSNQLVLPRDRVRNLFESYLFVDQGDTELANSIKIVENLLGLARIKVEENTKVSAGDDNKIILDEVDLSQRRTLIIEAMTNLFNEATKNLIGSVRNHLDNFNINKTVYVDNSGYYYDDNTTNFDNIIIANGTTIIPELDNASGEGSSPNISINTTNPIFIPPTVSMIDPESVLNGTNLPSGNVVASNDQQAQAIVKLNSNIQPIVSSTIDNSYDKYDLIENVEIICEYGVLAYRPTDQIFLIDKHTISNTFGTYFECNEIDNIKFNFEAIEIKKGSSIDMKQYTDQLGNKTISVNIYDQNGILYAKGLMKYKIFK